MGVRSAHTVLFTARCGGAVRCDGARLSGRRAASDGGLMRSPGLEPGRWPSTRNASGGANAARTLPGACAFDVRRSSSQWPDDQRFAIYIRWSSDWHAQAGVGQTPAEAGSGGGSRGQGSPQGRSTRQKLFALPRPGSFEMRTGNSPILIGAETLKPALLHYSFGICAIIGPPATS